jgi:hypothetical protein
VRGVVVLARPASSTEVIAFLSTGTKASLVIPRTGVHAAARHDVHSSGE